MLTLKIAKSDDAQKLGELYYQCWHQTYPLFFEKEYLEDMSLEKCVEKFEKTNCRNIVEGYLNNQLIGFCRYGEAEGEDLMKNTAQIFDIFVLKEYQLNGYGRKMLHQAIRELRQDDYRQLVIWSLDDHVEFKSFCEAVGLRSDGTKKEYSDNIPLMKVRYFENI